MQIIASRQDLSWREAIITIFPNVSFPTSDVNTLNNENSHDTTHNNVNNIILSLHSLSTYVSISLNLF